MRYRVVAVAATLGLVAAAPTPTTLDFGRPATPQEIAGENIDVHPDGTGLPPGQGSVEQGAALYASKCAACHGEHGQKPLSSLLRLTGGQGTLATPKAVETVGSYWPYATTLFDYIRRAMPFAAPRALTNDEIYAVTAYLLRLNGILPDGITLDAHTLPLIRMPNRDGFIDVYVPGH